VGDLQNINFQNYSIDEIEEKMLQEEQADCPIIHKFSPGLYIRELHAYKGTLIVGHEQKTTHFNVMLKGRILLMNEDGSSTELIAPQSFTAKSGRKVAYVLEDMIWQNIYPTTETDIEKLEETYLNKSDNWKYNQKLQMDMNKLSRIEDQEDFDLMAKDIGYSKNEIRKISENKEDQIEIILNDTKVKIDDSPIEGKGIFATYPIFENELIAPARLNGFRTQLGRYTNHAKEPNARFVNVDSNIFLFANRNIKGCIGGENGEEITVDYRQAILESNKLSKEALCLE